MSEENKKPDNQNGEQDAAIQAKIDEAVKVAVKTATDPLNESITNLTNKNNQLIDEKRNAEQKARDAKTKKAHEDGDIETVRARITEELNEKFGADVAERDDLKKQLNTLLVDNGLKEQLTGKGVSANLIEAAVYLIKGKYATEVKDGAPLVDGQPMNDFVTKFVEGEHGKHLLKAPDNAGGGAGGSGQGGTPASKKASEMSISEKTAFIAEHGGKAWQQKLTSEMKK